MSEFETGQVAPIEINESSAMPKSEPVNTGVLPVEPDATETEVAETDEQKNARELKEREERTAKRAQGVQKRMDELTRDKYAERAAREAAERLNAELLAIVKGGGVKPAADTTGEPKREQFDDYEKYLEARTEYRATKIVESRLAQQQQAWQQQSQQRQMAEQGNQLATQFQQRLAEGRAKIPDFDEVIADAAEVDTGNAFPAIATSDNPAVLMHYLAKNPTVASRLAALPPVMAAREVGKIEAALSASPQVSKAPPPGKPVGPRSGATRDPSKMNFDEYVKWRHEKRR